MAQSVVDRGLTVVADPMQLYEQNRRPSTIDKIRNYAWMVIPLFGLFGGAGIGSKSWAHIPLGMGGMYLGVKIVQRLWRWAEGKRGEKISKIVYVALPLCGLFGGVAIGSKTWAQILLGMGGMCLVYNKIVPLFDSWAEGKRIETAEQRALFCQAVLRNHVRPLPSQPSPPTAGEKFLTVFKNFFSRRAPAPARETERPIVTKQSYLQEVSGSEPATLEECFRVMVECILRSSTKPTWKNLPRIFFPKIAEMQRLQKNFRNLPRREKERFSLLRELEQIPDDCGPVIDRESPLYLKIYDYFFPLQESPQVTLWKEARNLAGYVNSLQGTEARETWMAFTDSADGLLKEFNPKSK